MRSTIGFLAFFLIFIFPACTSHNDDHEEEEHHHEEGVTLSEEQAKAFGVEYETVSPGLFHDVIKTSGSIEQSGADTYTVSAKKSGVVRLAPDITTGTEINEGQRIATITAEGLQGGDINQAATTNLRVAKAEYERLQPLYEDGLVTASVFREAERAYHEAEALAGKGVAGGTVALSSPQGGSVVQLFVKSGDYVEVGAPIATIVKNSRQILKADLPVRESKHLLHLESANFIPEGSQHLLKLQDLDGKKISGGNTSGASNGYIPVYFSFLGNPSLSPAGYAEVFLICDSRRNVISVPREALVEVQGNKYAYVVDDDGDLYEKRLVKTGATDGERVEILEGLNPGERVVSKGGSVIRMAEISSIAPPSHTHNH